MKRDTTSPVIRLHADAARTSRYPRRVWLDGVLVELRSESDAGERVVGSVMDDPTKAVAPASESPVLLGVDVLANLTRSGGSESLADRDWLPLLAFDRSSDIQVVRERVAAGDIGVPQLVEITVPLGMPPLDGWELDYVAAISELEALVFGAHAAEQIAGARVESSTWVRNDPELRVMLHRLDRQVDVVHRIFPADVAPVSAIEGEVIGDAGRIIVRREFAPGAVGLWRRERPGYVFPAVQQPKDDVQAPDSVPGGWELASILLSLVTGNGDRVELRNDAVRLIRHMSPMISGERDDH